jgi:hypothetical protein
MFDQLSAEIVHSLIKGVLTTTKQNVNLAVHCVYSRVNFFTIGKCGAKFKILKCSKQTLSPFSQQSTLVIHLGLIQQSIWD